MHPMQLGLCHLVGWTILQYWIASILKGCEGVAIIISAVLVLVLLDYVNPVQLWLCGLVGHNTTIVHELCS